MRLLTRSAFLIFLLAAALFYGNVVQNATALDDVMVLTENTFVKDGIGGWWDIISHDSFYGATLKPATKLGWRYRPLSLVCFAAIYEFFGPAWHVFHAFSILLYALCAWAIYKLFKTLLFNQKPLVALTGGMLFLIAPVHTEVVANIKSCDELLSLLFTILCIEHLSRATEQTRGKGLFISVVYFILALFSKESAVIAVAIIPLVLITRGIGVRSALKLTLPFGLATLAFVILRLAISSTPESAAEITNDPYLYATSTEKLATVAFVLLEYLRLMVYPVPMLYDYSYNHIPYRELQDFTVLASILIHLFLLGLGIYHVWRKGIEGVFLLAYLMSILLLSNLFIDVGPILAERFLFSPSVYLIGACCAYAVQSFPKAGEKALLVLLVISVVPAFKITRARNRDWKDNATLYAADLKKAPNSFRAHAFYAMTEAGIAETLMDSLEKARRFKECIAHFNRAYEIHPGYKNMYRNWGFSYFVLGDLDSAAWAWKRYKELDPDNPYNELNDRMLADARYKKCMLDYNNNFAKGNLELLSSILENALTHKPGDPDALKILAKVYFLQGRREAAVGCWEKVIAANPTDEETKRYLQDYKVDVVNP